MSGVSKVKPERGSPPYPITVPRDIVNADSVYLVNWLLADLSRVEPGTSVCEIETSKATIDVEVERSGYLRHSTVVGEEIPIGGILGYVTVKAGSPIPDPRRNQPSEKPNNSQISARAKRKIKELDLDESLFAGYSFVREEDVLKIAESPGSKVESVDDVRGPYRVTELNPIQRRVARSMEAGTVKIPVSYMDRSIDFNAVGSRVREEMAELKTLLSATDLLAAAVVTAVQKHSSFNACLNSHDRLQIFEEVNVGVAVEVDSDLYVTVVKKAERKSLLEISRELRALQLNAQRRSLQPEHLSGGTITVTSLIGRGIHRFQPLLYPKQVAIVGMSALEADSAEAVLTLGFDHRIANGSQAADFLAAVTEDLLAK